MTEEPIKVVLFAADCGGYDIERSMEELAALAQANGMEAVAEVVQKRETPEAATFWAKAAGRGPYAVHQPWARSAPCSTPSCPAARSEIWRSCWRCRS